MIVMCHVCDDIVRWLIEWYEYHFNDQNILVYSVRRLFGSKRKPNLIKHILWTDSSCYIQEPFNLNHVLTLSLPKILML